MTDLSAIVELDRRHFLNLLDNDLGQLTISIKKSFQEQLVFLSDAAALYYQSQSALHPNLIRPFLIGLIDGEADVKDRFGSDYEKLIQSAHDIAFLRQLMVVLKSASKQLNQQERTELINTSHLSSFREKLNQQENWKALIKVMEIV